MVVKALLSFSAGTNILVVSVVEGSNSAPVFTDRLDKDARLSADNSSVRVDLSLESCSNCAIFSSFLSSKISDILLNLFNVKGSKFVILVRFLGLEPVVDSLLDSEVVVVNTSISFVALLQSFKEI